MFSFFYFQDTVVALDALSKFSVTAGMKPNAKVQLLAVNQDEEITIGDEDRLKTKRIDLKEADNTIHLRISGQGCLLAQVRISNYTLVFFISCIYFLQAVLSYNVHNLAQSQAFTLNVDVLPVSTTDRCSVNTINACVAYNGPDAVSNMAIMEIGLPSGYQPDRTSLYQLVDQSDSTYLLSNSVFLVLICFLLQKCKGLRKTKTRSCFISRN